MKKLVAYFSASGITAKLAATLAKAADAELFEIRPPVLYTEADLDWRDKNSRSTVEMTNPASRPEMACKKEDLAAYDVIYVGFPVWWGVAPHIINTFLESADLTGKTVVPFATSGGGGVELVNAALKDSVPGAKLLETALFPGDASAETLADWIKTL